MADCLVVRDLGASDRGGLAFERRWRHDLCEVRIFCSAPALVFALHVNKVAEATQHANHDEDSDGDERGLSSIEHHPIAGDGRVARHEASAALALATVAWHRARPLADICVHSGSFALAQGAACFRLPQARPFVCWALCLEALGCIGGIDRSTCGGHVIG